MSSSDEAPHPTENTTTESANASRFEIMVNSSISYTQAKCQPGAREMGLSPLGSL
jgi:hypothetical protein